MKEPIKELLVKEGCENIEHYTLVNNTGYTFTKDSIKYDIRHWVNCYGVETDFWDCYSTDKYCDYKFIEQLNLKVRDIESEE